MAPCPTEKQGAWDGEKFFSEAQAEGQHDAVSFFCAASVVAKLQFGAWTEIVCSTYSPTQAGLVIGLTADINLRVDDADAGNQIQPRCVVLALVEEQGEVGVFAT
jgi:hypothetical protein